MYSSFLIAGIDHSFWGCPCMLCSQCFVCRFYIVQRLQLTDEAFCFLTWLTVMTRSAAKMAPLRMLMAGPVTDAQSGNFHSSTSHLHTMHAPLKTDRRWCSG